MHGYFRAYKGKALMQLDIISDDHGGQPDQLAPSLKGFRVSGRNRIQPLEFGFRTVKPDKHLARIKIVQILGKYEECACQLRAVLLRGILPVAPDNLRRHCGNLLLIDIRIGHPRRHWKVTRKACQYPRNQPRQKSAHRGVRHPWSSSDCSDRRRSLCCHSY